MARQNTASRLDRKTVSFDEDVRSSEEVLSAVPKTRNVKCISKMSSIDEKYSSATRSTVDMLSFQTASPDGTQECRLPRSRSSEVVKAKVDHLKNMWFPTFPNPATERKFVEDVITPPMRRRTLEAYTVLLAIALASCAFKAHWLGWVSSKGNWFLYFAWVLQLSLVQSALLLRRIRCVELETAWAVLAGVLFSSLLWTDTWRVGFLFTGDGRSCDGRASEVHNDEALLLSFVTGVALVTHCFPLRSRQATVVLLPAPLYAIGCAARDLSPSGADVSKVVCNVILLFAVSFFSWSGSRQREVWMRTEWLRHSFLKSEVSERRLKSHLNRVEETAQEVREFVCEMVGDGADRDDILKEAFELATSLRSDMTEEMIEDEVNREEKDQSDNGGISASYLLSDDFLNLGRDRIQEEEDPNFYELKDVFFFGDDAIGRDIRCPRDGELGCSLLDALPRKNRRRCTHFLSWAWTYRLQMFRASIAAWIRQDQLHRGKVFLYCCFFVNNQYRLLVQEVACGSVDLETAFIERLRGIGKMVAMVDGWHQPVYLTRIWTIFEQSCAVSLGVPVTVILPPDASSSLVKRLEMGKQGIEAVKRELGRIDSENARAWRPEDELSVKEFIRATSGFANVNKAVSQSLMSWVGITVSEHFRGLAQVPDEEEAFGADFFGASAALEVDSSSIHSEASGISL